MPNAKTVIVMRHPQREGSTGGKGGQDAISADGARQAWAMATLVLKAVAIQIVRVYYSGAMRTKQTARLVLAALDLDLPVDAEKRFNFSDTLKATVGNGDAFWAEVDAIKATLPPGHSKPTVADAMRHGSKYCIQGREMVTAAILAIAETLEPDTVALAFSHGPWAELATVHPDTTPYGIGEATAVEYTIVNSEIVESRLLEPPIPGASYT